MRRPVARRKTHTLKIWRDLPHSWGVKVDGTPIAVLSTEDGGQTWRTVHHALDFPFLDGDHRAFVRSEAFQRLMKRLEG